MRSSTSWLSWNLYCYLPRGIQANVSHNGKISGQKRKIAVRIEAAHAVKCLWSTPEAEAPFRCRLAMYIVVLFTSGSAAPSFLDPSNFWLKTMYISIDMWYSYCIIKRKSGQNSQKKQCDPKQIQLSILICRKCKAGDRREAKGYVQLEFAVLWLGKNIFLVCEMIH